MRSQGQYNVFISVKNLDDSGASTPDRQVAHELWSFLTARGLRVFLSDVSLAAMGVSSYTKAIDDALDRTDVVVVVCSEGEYAESRWVRYEWDSFLSDIRSGVKEGGEVFTYLVGEEPRNLPRALRHCQCFKAEVEGFEGLFEFLRRATEFGPDETQLIDAHQQPPREVVPFLGEWRGTWKRDSGSIVHNGRLSLETRENVVLGELLVSFSKGGMATELKETLRGVMTARGIVLQGQGFEYLEQGNSTSLPSHISLKSAFPGRFRA